MPNYSYKLKDPRWQKKRLQILEHARWKCEDCGGADQTLEIHHCVYLPKKEPWEHGIEELMCLCSDCHKVRQDFEDMARIELGRHFRSLSRMEAYQMAWNIADKFYRHRDTLSQK